MEDVTDTVFRQIIIHGRTVSEMSDSPARWDEIGKAVKLRDSMKSKTLIIGNGDVKTREDAMEKYKKVLQNLHFRLAGCKKCADGAYEIQNRL